MSRRPERQLLTIPPKPEPKTEPLALKVKKSTKRALEKAAAKHGYTKSGMAEAIIEVWLRNEGWLNE
jgi:hypothetical protein